MAYSKPLFLLIALFFVSYGWGQLSVMTYNIRYDNPDDGQNQWTERKAEVVAMLNYYEPDIIGLQEALNHQREFIDHNIAGYASVGFGRDGEGTISEATPLFYKTSILEILDTHTFWLSPTPDVPSKGWDASLNRIATYAKFRIKASGRIIHVFNTHFDHLGEKAREMSAQLLVEKINELKIGGEPIILMGDLNCEGTDSPYSVLTIELQDSYKGSPTNYGPIGTWNGFEILTPITRKIDYIFSKNLTVISCRHIDDRRENNLQLSDHLPVLTVFRD